MKSFELECETLINIRFSTKACRTILSTMKPEKIPITLKSYTTPRKPPSQTMIRRPQSTRPWKLNQIDQEKLQPDSIQPTKYPPVILDNRLIQCAKDQSKQESLNPSVELRPMLRNKAGPSSEPIEKSPLSPYHQNDESLTDTPVYNINIELELDDTENGISAYKTSEHAQADPNNRLASANTPFLKPQGNVNPERNHNYGTSHIESLLKSVLTPQFCSPNAIDFSAQRQIPTMRRKSSATMTQPVQKKARGNIESVPTRQMYQHLNHDRNFQNPGSPYPTMNNLVAQNLSNLAHQAHISQLQFFQPYTQAHGIPISPEVPVSQGTYTQNPRAEYNQSLLQTQQPLNKNRNPAPRNASAVDNQVDNNLDALLHVHVPVEEPHTLTGFLNNQKEILRKLQFAKLSVSSTKVDEFPPIITQNSVLETTNVLEEMQSEVRSPEETVQQSEAEKHNDDQITDEELIKDYGDKVTSQESGYKTDRHPSKDLHAPISEDEVSIEASTDAEDEIHSQDNAPGITEEESMDAPSLVSSDNLSKESALKMLEAHGLMLIKMYRNFLKTEDYYNDLRLNTLGCLRLYQIMKKCVVEDDKESCPDPAPKEKAPEVVEEPTEEQIEKPAPEPSPAVKNIPNGYQKECSNSKIKKPEKDDKKQRFVLPPEYDPKDSKWTLRYKGPGRKLRELIPGSGVYLKRTEYNKCTKKADSCRKLARTLLKAVFTENALGVCSLTGAKARAFNDMVTRPGLDKEARMVFLKFIEDFGKERDWDTSDTAGIISSIRTKMLGMRRKYEKLNRLQKLES